MKKLIIIFLLFTALLFSCSEPEDLKPNIEGRFPNVEYIYYPSSDFKACAVVVDSNGDVWYFRANGFGTIRDEKFLFNTHNIK